MKIRQSKKASIVTALMAAMMILFAACSSSDSAETASFDQAEAGAEFEESMDDESFDEEMSDEVMADGDAGADVSFEDVELAQETEGESGEESELGSGGSTAVSQTAAETGRKVIFTANLTVEVTDVASAGAQATDIIESEGGFLFGQETVGGAEAQSILTFKVDPDRFDSALEKLGGVGELRNQTVSADDVTGPIVDLQSRIEVAELSVVRLKEALAETPTLEDFAEIEALLIARESELAVMKGQLRTLQSRVNLATITVSLVQDRVVNNLELTITAYEGFDNGQACPGDQRLRPEADSEVTVCFELVNTGDQTLTDITITDTVLEIDENSKLIEVFETLDELQPGQSAVAAFETVPQRFTTLRTRVTAVPTDGTSSEQVAPTVTANGSYDLQVFGEEDNAGFGDGFSASVDVLSQLWIVVKVLVGFLLPMLIFLPFLWLAWFGLKALRRRRPAKPAKVPAGPMPMRNVTPGAPMGQYQTPPPPTAQPVPTPQPAATPGAYQNVVAPSLQRELAETEAVEAVDQDTDVEDKANLENEQDES